MSLQWNFDYPSASVIHHHPMPERKLYFKYYGKQLACVSTNIIGLAILGCGWQQDCWPQVLSLTTTINCRLSLLFHYIPVVTPPVPKDERGWSESDKQDVVESLNVDIIASVTNVEAEDDVNEELDLNNKPTISYSKLEEILTKWTAWLESQEESNVMQILHFAEYRTWPNRKHVPQKNIGKWQIFIRCKNPIPIPCRYLGYLK